MTFTVISRFFDGFKGVTQLSQVERKRKEKNGKGVKRNRKDDTQKNEKMKE